ncbi:IS110 family transposase [Paenibacillus piscarius]|uniref:IS110 family transposase n=1 Tax=Paenibacillus piscarius TaxID=1089681 RepID=UPI001EE8D31A|nr:IS110 family transposase [Paenibacillus piscarius]
MKFKQSAQQNQRIERITSHHLIVGIDIAKFTHVARATDYRGIERGTYLSFSNDQKGFEKLFQWMQALQFQFHKTDVIFGVEPTGHYWFNLALWLQEKQLELVLVNPFQVKRNKENRDNSPTKNDIKDALVIADMVKNGYYSDLYLHTGPFQALRQLVNTRDYLSKQASSVVNQIYRWTDIYFPEFQQVFKDITSKTALATLAEFAHPSDLCALSVQEVILGWKKRLKRAGSHKVAVALLYAAQRTVGSPESVEEAKLSLSMLLQQLQLFHDQMELLKEKINQILQTIPTTKNLRSIKGIHDITLAALYSEAGDFSRFAHGNQLLRLAGLHLSENSSGLYKGQVKITKRGRPGLRKILFIAVFQMVSINPEFRALHQHNKRVKHMTGMKSIMKLCGKLARMLVAMSKNGSDYDSCMVNSVA